MPRLAIGETLKDTYRVVKRLGGGGMGEVYEAEHTRLAGRYAIKVLLPEAAADENAFRRFRREAEIASSLQHPNIVQVIDFDVMADGAPYLVMELLKGRDLDDKLRELGKMPPQRVVDIIEQTAAGLSAAHARGIVHRDLKPANVFIVPMPGGQRELVKLVDFGISKILAAKTKLTADASLIGTPQYMSPEQARGGEVGPETDQFALAIIARELLTGMPPFAADTFPVLLYKIVHEEPLGFAELGLPIPEGVEEVLNRAMRKKASDRYASVAQFSEALLQAVDEWLLGATVAVSSSSKALAFERTQQSAASPSASPSAKMPQRMGHRDESSNGNAAGDTLPSRSHLVRRRAWLLGLVGTALALSGLWHWRHTLHGREQAMPALSAESPPTSLAASASKMATTGPTSAATASEAANPSLTPQKREPKSAPQGRAGRGQPSPSVWSDIAPPNPYQDKTR